MLPCLLALYYMSCRVNLSEHCGHALCAKGSVQSAINNVQHSAMRCGTPSGTTTVTPCSNNKVNDCSAQSAYGTLRHPALHRDPNG